MWFRTVSVIVTLGFLAALRTATAQPRRTIPVIGVLANADLSAAFANPTPVTAIGQTDFSPLGGTRSQVTGPPLRQLDMGFARQFGIM